MTFLKIKYSYFKRKEVSKFLKDKINGRSNFICTNKQRLRDFFLIKKCMPTIYVYKTDLHKLHASIATMHRPYVIGLMVHEIPVRNDLFSAILSLLQISRAYGTIILLK